MRKCGNEEGRKERVKEKEGRMGKKEVEMYLALVDGHLLDSIMTNQRIHFTTMRDLNV